MERSLSGKGLLLPLNEIIDSIGADDLYDVVKKLNCHADGNCYDLAHELGADLIVYREDFCREAGRDLGRVARAPEGAHRGHRRRRQERPLRPRPRRPGFFINEEVYRWTGSNGGRLFAENHRPTFTEQPVLEMLAFWKELADCCLAPDRLSHGSLDTFAMLATGKVASIYGWGRGSDYFEKYAPEAVERGDIGIFPSKPVGPSGQEFLTQLDCEPWMVFKDAKHPQEAIDFLKFFYQPENYRPYIQSVPIHFFPITKSMQADPEYLATPAFVKWADWRDAQFNVIQNHDPKPLMITEWDDLELPFVQELASSGILIDMVTDVVVRDVSPADAAARAQERAEELITQLGYKKW